MKNILLAAIGAVVVIGLVIAGVLLFLTHATPAAQTPDTTGAQTGGPFGGTTVVSNNGTAAAASSTVNGVTAADGSVIPTRNFKGDSSFVESADNKGHYYFGYHFVTPTSTPPYVVEYIASSDTFVISLFAEPLGDVRLQMEQSLEQSLGISEVDMCRLDYSVSVPNWVNSSYAGINLKFSFCPDATPL